MMPIPDPERLLRCMRQPSAIIALTRDGRAFGVFADGDQRRRPRLIFPRATLAQLIDEGFVEQAGRGAYRLTERQRLLQGAPSGEERSAT